jgi:Tfp pilus assembly protein PilF
MNSQICTSSTRCAIHTMPAETASDLVDRGLACIERNDLAGASQLFKQATTIDPTMIAAFLNLGASAFYQHDHQTAACAYAHALDLDANSPQAHLGLAAINAMADRLDDALRHSETALNLDGCADAYGNTGVLYRRCGDRERALAAFEIAIEKEPAEWLHHVNRAIELLVLGRFTEGWQEYEHRRAVLPKIAEKFYWSGEQTDHLLIRHEQGFGDTMMFARFLSPASQCCQRLTVVVHPELLSLMRTSFAHNSRITITTACPDDFDYYCFIGSLPGLFRADATSIPEKPYLCVPRNKVTPPADGLRVGIAWAGQQRPDIDSRRSMSLEQFGPILELSGIDVVSLQKLYPSDWLSTAEAVNELDLVITVDTAIAHLAGAMGKPVWLLNRFDTCWRWLLDRSDSVWYSNMRIFRQPAIGDWSSVIATVVGELAEMRDGKYIAKESMPNCA